MDGGHEHSYPNPAIEALNGRVARYVAVAGLIVLLYDLIITMREEVSSHLLRFFDTPFTFRTIPGPLGLARRLLCTKAPLLHQPLPRRCVHDV
jgi:hypothetical protein